MPILSTLWAFLQAVTIETGITLSPTFFIGIIGGFMAFASLRSTVGHALKAIAEVKQDVKSIKAEVSRIDRSVAEMRGALRARGGLPDE